MVFVPTQMSLKTCVFHNILRKEEGTMEYLSTNLMSICQVHNYSYEQLYIYSLQIYYIGFHKPIEDPIDILSICYFHGLYLGRPMSN